LATVQKTNNMKKNSAFQLRSGNKPSMAQLSGVSPMKKKYNPFSAESKRMTASQKRAAQDADPTFKGNKQKIGDELKAAKSKVNTKLNKDIASVASNLDKGIQSLLPKSLRRKTNDNDNNNSNQGGFKPQVRKDNWGTYRTIEGGGYEYKAHDNTSGTFTKAKSKKGIAAIDKLFKNK